VQCEKCTSFSCLCEHARLHVLSWSNFSGRNAASSVIGYEMLYTHFFQGKLLSTAENCGIKTHCNTHGYKIYGNCCVCVKPVKLVNGCITEITYSKTANGFGSRATPDPQNTRNAKQPLCLPLFSKSVVLCLQSVTCTVLLYAAAFVGPKCRG
jgi:hypothetical protein